MPGAGREARRGRLAPEGRRIAAPARLLPPLPPLPPLLPLPPPGAWLLGRPPGSHLRSGRWLRRAILAAPFGSFSRPSRCFPVFRKLPRERGRPERRLIDDSRVSRALLSGQP